ncbi:hypothetical protein TRFO_39769 [Tritrichomonas foetus]|uniref:CLASP N-terminal domain-containing protein n=1 Tax=Tritrichomonas foetus TaxID=1144522 RepID=A0A1J4J3W3_9EUKA|nr:hypothetical protein TRFO_39769 [Tritrichomonas foetus]|eukprot:OHS94050.1 hypothetical protein TRFO_39769 [Tritrichomonas foetus]
MEKIRRISNPESDQIIQAIFEEANSDVGTWALTSMNNFSSIFPRCSPANARSIVDSIVTQLKDSGKSQTRYKLAQLCSFINHMKLPFFKEAMLPHIMTIQTFCKKYRNEPLGTATCNLLQATFSEESLRFMNKSPPPTYSPNLRHMSPRTVVSSGTTISRTPDF